LAARLHELAQYAPLQRQLDEEKARGDALERLSAAASPAEVEAARALVSHA
jgi:hypothetical protein